MKLRLIPIAITVVVTFSLLFGGWFAYQHVAVAKPLNQSVTSITGVKQAQVQLSRNQAVFNLELKPDADLREIYRQLQNNNAALIGNRKIVVHVENAASPELDAIWSNALFSVAQAMDTKQYAQIPSAMKQLEQANQGLRILTEMDAANVYIRMTSGHRVKFIVLPRVETTGVWSGE